MQKNTTREPLLSHHSVQMDQRFNGEDRHARGLLSLVPSLLLDSAVNPDEYINDMLKWENDLQYPKSLGSEIRRWKGLWINIKLSGKNSEIPKSIEYNVTGIPFQTSISCLLLAAHYLYQVQKQNVPFP